MHELSLVMGIIDLASMEAKAHGAPEVEEIVLDIGELSGVEIESFDFAWTEGVKGTILEGAERKINRIPGKGKCLDCETEFSLQQYYDPCPNCGEHLIEVLSGKEMKVKTVTLRIADYGLRIDEKNP
jgi:hydrogenase nickel incorporation protein HypA/HybF